MRKMYSFYAFVEGAACSLMGVGVWGTSHNAYLAIGVGLFAFISIGVFHDIALAVVFGEKEYEQEGSK